MTRSHLYNVDGYVFIIFLLILDFKIQVIRNSIPGIVFRVIFDPRRSWRGGFRDDTAEHYHGMFSKCNQPCGMRESSRLAGPYACETSFVGGNLKCTLDFSDVSFQSLSYYIISIFSLAKIHSRHKLQIHRENLRRNILFFIRTRFQSCRYLLCQFL